MSENTELESSTPTGIDSAAWAGIVKEHARITFWRDAWAKANANRKAPFRQTVKEYIERRWTRANHRMQLLMDRADSLQSGPQTNRKKAPVAVEVEAWVSHRSECLVCAWSTQVKEWKASVRHFQGTVDMQWFDTFDDAVEWCEAYFKKSPGNTPLPASPNDGDTD